MDQYLIRNAKPDDFDFAFELYLAAGRGMLERFLGCGSKGFAYQVMKFLWTAKPNRMHYRNGHILEVGNERLGFLSSYAVGVDDYSALKSLLILKAGGVKLLWHYLTHLEDLVAVSLLPEGRKGEYYIDSVAVTSNSRGMGVGSKLVQYAISQAKALNLNTVSLMVAKDNEEAIKLYQRLGFNLEDSKRKNHPLAYHMFMRVSC